MNRHLLKTLGLLLFISFIYIPAPAADMPADGKSQTIVRAGGCFWGIQAVFQHVKGVTEALSGYAGGEAATAHYEDVGTGTTGHAESVQVTYNASQVTLEEILKVFFAVAHDPTELNRQGPDTGPQYRSAIFFATPEQQKIAAAYIAQLEQTKAFSAPIVTTVEPLKKFYPAEDYHQDYASTHPYSPYIVRNDLPKVEALKKKFPDLYVEKTQ
jgi:peptide-methionine (S)-S-oxide reductase